MKELIKNKWNKMTKRQRLITIGITIFLLIGIIEYAFEPQSDTTNNKKTKSKVTSTAVAKNDSKNDIEKLKQKADKKPQTLSQYMKSENPDIIKFTNGKDIEIQVYIQSNKKETLSVKSWEILQSLCERKDYLKTNTVTVITKADYTDKYGKVTKDITSTSIYKPSELKKINWGTVDNSQMFNLATSSRFRHDVLD